ncbi:Ig-like domain-containing protein [Pirellulales bacterium]|nr:Ig-like domain-containing protein [Pirellulales bacterium]
MASSRRTHRRRQQASFRRHQLRLEGLEKRYALNAAPVLDDSASPTLGSILEDTGAPVGPAGTLVSDLIDAGGPLNNFSDVDGDQPGIAITDTNLQSGALWYSRDDGVSWFDVGVLSDTQPLLMPSASGSRIYYEPAPDFNGTIADVFTIKAWDQNTVLEQIGEDLVGEANGDLFGRGVTISADGSTVVVGGMKNDSQAADAGHARVFRWNGTSWSQLGTDIEGLAPLGFFGYRVVVSDNGNRFAVSGHESNAGGSYSGLVQVYEWDGVNWLQLGQDLVGNPGDLFGHALAHSGDLSVLAVGAHHGGYVEIYKWNGITWEQRGTRIVGDHTGDGIGSSETLSISHDGNVLSTGRVWADTNGVNSGLVRVYEWASHDWVQRGADILGQDANEYFARTALSGDGNTLAVGASDGDGARDRTGRVAVYRWSGQAWHQLGNSLYGSITGEQFGASVAISHDGGTIVVGADRANGGLVDSGKTQVYRFIGSDWHSIGSPIYGTTSYQRLGVDVDISQDGSTIIVGAIFKNHSIQPGLARVYGINASDSSTSTDSDTVSVEVQALNDTPVLQGDQSISLAQVQEDSGAPVGAVGSLVSELIDASGPRNNFSDVDGDLPGIAIVEQDLQGGTLWHSLDNGVTWEAVGTASEGEPFLLFSDSATRLYYQPAADFSGTLTSVVKFRAWDGNASWEKVGLDLIGEGDGDALGRASSISSDGRTIAVGSFRNDQGGSDAGSVQVYQWSGSVWTQLGEVIVGASAGDYLGSQLDLSGDGQRLVVGINGSDLNGVDAGIAKVFEWTGQSWVQLGAALTGDGEGSGFGGNLQISRDGQTVAVGSSEDEYAVIYSWNGSAWTQLGDRFTGVNGIQSISFSKDGTIVALGGAGPDDTPSNSGKVRVFTLQDNTWVQLGADVDGDLAGGLLSKTALSEDGMTLAVGAGYYGAGYVRVFRWNTSGWEQLGEELRGKYSGDMFGFSVALSGNGSRLIVGAVASKGNSQHWGGEVQAFRWDGTDWLAVGQAVHGVADQSRIGFSVDSSSDGNIFIAGSYQENVSGRASVFRRVAATGSTSSEIGELSVDVLAVNDAPVLDTNSSPTLEPIAEDAGVPVGQVGTLVSSLIDTDGPLNNFSDIDGDLPGIAITGTNLQGGTLWYSTDDGATWLDVGAVSETEPQLLAADANTRLYFQPAADFSGTISDVISFKAWDGNFEWIYYGENIEGDLAGGRFGYKVALSEDGQRLVVTAIENSRNGTWSGEVKFFDWNPAAMNWESSGSTLAGESAGDFFGISLGFASNTDFISIGSMYSTSAAVNSGEVRIFERDAVTGEYVQRGDALTGIEAGERFGHASDISEDGKTVVVGADKSGLGGEDSGRVSVFRWNDVEGIWDTLGQEFIGNAGDRAGHSVTISGDGNHIAYGSPLAREVRVFEWVLDSQAWVEKGPKLVGLDTESGSWGSDVCFSDDGQRLAVSGLTAGESAEGAVTVYEWSQSEGRWLTLGEVIVGEAAGDYFGRSLSFAENGNTVVVGARKNDGGGNGSGHARVFNWDETAGVWSQVGQDLDGALPGDDAGVSVSMIPNGTLVAVGADYADPNGNQSGSVQVYKKFAVLSESGTTVGVTINSVNDPPTGDVTVDGIAEEDRVLTATNDLADIDGLGVIAYEWSRDGDLISGATASTYTLTQDDVGSTITATARYTDNHGTLETVTSSATSPVLNVNDAPVLDPAASPQLVSVLEDAAAPVGQVGTLVSALIDAGGTHNNFGDVDSDLPAIAITDFNLSSGSLYYSIDDGVTWSEVTAVSVDSALGLYADETTRIYFQPASNFEGTISDVITFQGWDRSGASANGDIGLNTNPPVVGSIDTPGLAYEIALSNDGSIAYLAERDSNLQIFDVSDPNDPNLVGTLDNPSGLDVKLSKDGAIAFIAAWDAGLIISDVQDPTNPTTIGSLGSIGKAHGLALSADENTAYVADWDGNLQIINIVDRESPSLIATLGGFGTAHCVTLSPDGTIAHVSDYYGGLRIVDVSDSSNPAHITSINTTGNPLTHSLSSDGKTAYVAAYHGGLWIVDLSTPENPELISRLDTTSETRSISISEGRNLAYVADWHNGVHVVDISNPALPEIKVTIDTHGANRVRLSPDQSLAYVPDWDKGLKIIDLSQGFSVDSDSVSVDIIPVNDAPTLDELSDVNILEDASEQTVNLTGITAGGGETQLMSVTANSENTGLILDLTLDFDGQSSTGTLKFIPVADQFGTATITVTIEDGGLDNDLATVGDNATFSQTFDVDVTPVNDTPTLDPISDLVLPEDSQIQIIDITGITAGGGETQPLQVTVTSSNPSLISDPTITSDAVSVEGSKSLAFVPLADQYGITTITVTVEDGGLDLDLNTTEDNAILSRTFDVTVTPDTDNPPSPVTPHGRMFIHEILSGDPQVSYQLPAVNVNGEAINGLPTRVTVTSSNTALIPDPTVLYAAADVPSSLSFTPVASANGTATLSIQVEDGGPDNDFATTEDNRQATHQVEVNVLEIISNQGSAILAKDSTENLYVNTQPVVYHHEQQQAQSTIAGFAAIGATSEDGENALLVERASVTNRLVADDAWRINSLFDSLHNESSPVLDLSAREVSVNLNVVAVAGAYEINGARNPTLIVRRGQIYNFKLDVANHPLYLQTTGNGYQPENAFNRFFQGQGRTEGEHMWIVPADAPDELFYQCEFHPVMFGKIIIVD